MTSNIDRKRILLYIAFVFGIYYVLWLVAILMPENVGNVVYSILQLPLIFMGTPTLAVLITRKITSDKSDLKCSLKAWKNKKMCLFSAVIPVAAVFIGAIIFYLIFPQDLDFHGTYISETFGSFGAPSEITLTIPSILIIGLIICMVSSICIPSWLIALGEDIGWQGYLLPLLCKFMSVRVAVVSTGTLWGLAHAPLIYSGMNYDLGYVGAPFGGIAMMILFCITIGIWMSYVTLKTGNCMYAAIIHGSVNIIGETPVFISLSTQNPLLGPSPAGIIGMSILLFGAIILIWRVGKIKINKNQ